MSAEHCTRCRGAMLPEWGGYRWCPTCREEGAKRQRARTKTAKGRALHAKHCATWRGKNREDYNAGRMDDYYARRERKQCIACSEPALPTGPRCQKHRDAHVQAQREYRARRAGGQQRLIKPLIKPLPRKRPAKMPAPVRRAAATEPAPHEQLELPLRVRILRVVRFYDAATGEDIREHLGLGDDARDAVSAHLSRLTKRGLLARLPDRSRAEAAYRLTDEGRRAA